MGSGYSKMKKQAQKFQEQMAKMQEEMANLEVKGTAGSGLVEVMLSGEGDLKTISIKPDCVDPEDVEGLEDLIKAAFQNAQEQIKKQSPTQNILGGLPSGGLPFNL